MGRIRGRGYLLNQRQFALADFTALVLTPAARCARVTRAWICTASGALAKSPPRDNPARSWAIVGSELVRAGLSATLLCLKWPV